MHTEIDLDDHCLKSMTGSEKKALSDKKYR